MLDNEDRLFYDAIPLEFRSHEDECRFHERQLVRGLMEEEDARWLQRAAERGFSSARGSP